MEPNMIGAHTVLCDTENNLVQVELSRGIHLLITNYISCAQIRIRIKRFFFSLLRAKMKSFLNEFVWFRSWKFHIVSWWASFHCSVQCMKNTCICVISEWLDNNRLKPIQICTFSSWIEKKNTFLFHFLQIEKVSI